MLQANGSKFLLLFSLLKYAVHKTSYTGSKFPHFFISSNINSRQNGGKNMYPSCDVMFISALINSFALYVKRSIDLRNRYDSRLWHRYQYTHMHVCICMHAHTCACMHIRVHTSVCVLIVVHTHSLASQTFQRRGRNWGWDGGKGRREGKVW